MPTVGVAVGLYGAADEFRHARYITESFASCVASRLPDIHVGGSGRSQTNFVISAGTSKDAQCASLEPNSSPHALGDWSIASFRATPISRNFRR